MAAYQKGEFAAALPKLRAAAEANKRDAAAGFFAGVAELIAGDAAAGVAALRAVDALGFTPYQEEARFYLAKGLLRTGDVDGARKALTSAVAMKGDLEAQALKLLGELR